MKSTRAFCYLLTYSCTALIAISGAISNGEMEMILSFIKLQRKPAGLSLFCDATPKLAKDLLLNDQDLDFTLRFNQQIKVEEIVIFCADDANIEPEKLYKMLYSRREHAVGTDWLVVGTNSSLEEVLNVGSIDINKRVYFINSNLQNLAEVYHINNFTVNNQLGKFAKYGEITNLVWTEKRDFLQRRSNFYGLNFKAYSAQRSTPFSYFPPKVLRQVQWEKDRKGSLIGKMTGSPMGVMPEVLDAIGVDLNFSINYLIRKDNDIGYPIYENGKFRGVSGMIGNLHSKEADFITATMEFNIERSGLVSLSHPIAALTLTLLVSSDAGNEDREVILYLLPFETRLWMMLIANSVVVVMAIELLTFKNPSPWRCQIMSYVAKLFGNYWMIFMSYLGRPPSASTSSISRLLSAKVMLFVLFLSGNLVFMSYKAALTSELSLKRYRLPFTSPQGLYESHYRYTVLSSLCRLN